MRTLVAGAVAPRATAARASGWRILCLVVIFSASFGSACEPQSATERVPAQFVWQKLGTWSGNGSWQTESFISDTGGMRITWETHAADSRTGGSFTLSIHSAVSGRALATPVEHQTIGSGIAYVSIDPHVCYGVIDATGMQWTFTIEEAIPGQVIKSRN